MDQLVDPRQRLLVPIDKDLSVIDDVVKDFGKLAARSHDKYLCRFLCHRVSVRGEATAAPAAGIEARRKQTAFFLFSQVSV